MRLVVAFAFLAITGCAAHRREPYYLYNNASGALDCPEEELHAERSGRRAHRVYDVSGCGRTVRYRCHGDNCRAEEP